MEPPVDDRFNDRERTSHGLQKELQSVSIALGDLERASRERHEVVQNTCDNFRFKLQLVGELVSQSFIAATKPLDASKDPEHDIVKESEGSSPQLQQRCQSSACLDLAKTTTFSWGRAAHFQGSWQFHVVVPEPDGFGRPSDVNIFLV